MNPLMKNVFGAFEAVHDRPISISIDRKGVVFPAGGPSGEGHFQGIQRMPSIPFVGHERPNENLLVITSSSDQVAYFVTCSMADDWLSGHANPPTTMATRDINGFNHAGGCQSYGNFLVAGLENAYTETNSEIQFWDLKGASQRVPEAVQKTISRCTDGTSGHKCTAGAVGITSFGRGAVMAVASYNADTVDFYVSEGDPFRGSPLNKSVTWTESNANKNGWLDKNFAHYQNINLITETDQTLWMVAFDRSSSTDPSDWMDLYTVDLSADKNSVFRKAAKKHMYCSDGCTFDAGAGIFIASENEFDVYAVNPSSGDHNTGTTIHVNYFSAT
jgi:hypothetical protein